MKKHAFFLFQLFLTVGLLALFPNGSSALRCVHCREVAVPSAAECNRRTDCLGTVCYRTLLDVSSKGGEMYAFGCSNETIPRDQDCMRHQSKDRPDQTCFCDDRDYCNSVVKYNASVFVLVAVLLCSQIMLGL